MLIYVNKFVIFQSIIEWAAVEMVYFLTGEFRNIVYKQCSMQPMKLNAKPFSFVFCSEFSVAVRITMN